MTTLAAWWARPPDPLTFAAQVGFARKTHVDDRTVVGIWPDESDEDAGQEGGSRASEPLAEGGFGKVYRVAGYHLPGDHAALAYKEFTGSQQAEQGVRPGSAVVVP